MIIKEILIKNYQCYYDDKRFEFKKGSNIILGRNGAGKTKFFEALEWLFSNSTKDLDELVSKKKLHETIQGNSFNVGVEIIVEQAGLRSTIKKYFGVKKGVEKDFTTTNIIYEGIEENESGERESVDGLNLLNRVFPGINRKYALFKGEAELNILNNEDALLNLINMYTKIKHFGPYAEKGEMFRKYAEKAVDDATKGDEKNNKKLKTLENEINELKRSIQEKEIFLSTKYDERTNLEENINGVEKHLENAEAVETIKKRISDIDDNVKKLESKLDEDYTISLFDKGWFLIYFESIQKAYKNKIDALSKERRQLQRNFDTAEGIKEGERRAQAALFKDVIPLPNGTPSSSIMEEMLKDQICKVCNREALIDSPPYNFMRKRLDDYLLSQKPRDENDETISDLFKSNYTNRLVTLGATQEDNLIKIRTIAQTIKELFEFNQEIKLRIAELRDKKENEISDLENVIGNSVLGQDSLSHAYKNYKGWQKDLMAVDKKIEDYEKESSDLKTRLKQKREEKDSIDTKSVSSFLINTRTILRDIETIFKETKETKYDEFIKVLEDKANYFLKKINESSFTGYIEINRRYAGSKHMVNVTLMQEGERFYHPNTSLLTSMHLAILFAIAQLTQADKEESFPLIFDAPTSSFDPVKRKYFFEVLGNCNEQTILLTKDFTETDKTINALLYSDEFKNIKRDKAILIKLEEPFHPEILSTINTELINL